MRTDVKRIYVTVPVALLFVALVLVAWGMFRSDGVTDGTRMPPDGRSMSPSGDWRLARSGTERGVYWNMYLTDGKPTGTCASIELLPEPTENVARISALLYNGRQATCVTDPRQSVAATAPIALVRALQSDEARYNIVAGITADNVAELVISMDDQTTVSVPVVDRTFVVIYDRASSLQSIRVIESGGGSVSRCEVVPVALPSGGLDLRCQPAYS